MKKLLAMLLALVMCLSIFASCGSKDSGKNDEKDEEKAVENDSSSVGKKPVSSNARPFGTDGIGWLIDPNVESLRFSVMVDDLSSLKKYTNAQCNVEKTNIDFYIGFKESMVAAAVSSLVDGEEVDASFVANANDMVVESSVLEDVYGVNFAKARKEQYAYNYVYKLLSEGLPALYNINHAQDWYLTEYTAELFDALRNNLDVKERTKDNIRSFEFELDPGGLIQALSEYVDVVEEDKNIDDFCDAVGIPIETLTLISSPIYAIYRLSIGVDSDFDYPSLRLTFLDDKFLIGVEYEYTNEYNSSWSEGDLNKSIEFNKIVYSYDPDTEKCTLLVENNDTSTEEEEYEKVLEEVDNNTFKITYNGVDEYRISSYEYDYDWEIDYKRDENWEPVRREYECESESADEVTVSIKDGKVVCTVESVGYTDENEDKVEDRIEDLEETLERHYDRLEEAEELDDEEEIEYLEERIEDISETISKLKSGSGYESYEDTTVVEFNYELDGDIFRLELDKIERDDMVLDIGLLAGVSIEIEKNPTLPKISSKYEEVDVRDSDPLDLIEEKVISPIVEASNF
ncbi:MAG: hypothetical protein IJC81_05470 [Clostridia bacterium]|nr:hypothetical protein [Clostridia bacterium]